MRICIDERTFEGTPQDIVEDLRELLLDPDIAPDNEAYIEHIKRSYERITGEEMLLPETGIDERIRAMFRELDAMGFMEVLDE